VPVFALLEVKVLAARVTEALNNAISFNAINEPCMSFWTTYCLGGLFVGICAGIGPGKFLFRPFDELCEPFYVIIGEAFWSIA